MPSSKMLSKALFHLLILVILFFRQSTCGRTAYGYVTANYGVPDDLYYGDIITSSQVYGAASVGGVATLKIFNLTAGSYVFWRSCTYPSETLTKFSHAELQGSYIWAFDVGSQVRLFNLSCSFVSLIDVFDVVSLLPMPSQNVFIYSNNAGEVRTISSTNLLSASNNLVISLAGQNQISFDLNSNETQIAIVSSSTNNIYLYSTLNWSLIYSKTVVSTDTGHKYIFIVDSDTYLVGMTIAGSYRIMDFNNQWIELMWFKTGLSPIAGLLYESTGKGFYGWAANPSTRVHLDLFTYTYSPSQSNINGTTTTARALGNHKGNPYFTLATSSNLTFVLKFTDYTGFPNCTSTQYYNPANTSACLNCPVSCGTCFNSTYCLSCPANSTFYVGKCCSSNQYYASGNCQNCPSPCAACTNLSYCTSCNTNYTLMNNYCCLSNQYSSAAVCYNCSSNCLTCSSSSNCSACASSYLIMGGYCCLSNQYISGSTCITCSANCLTCSSSSNCSVCATNYTIMGGYCCRSNQYISGSSCLNCSSNCLTCSSSSNCSACATSYSIMGGYCCLSNQFISGSTCLNCSSNCLTCSSSSNCSVCATSYSIMGGYCCLSNQYLSGSSCINCPSTCSVCSSSSFCSACISNYSLMNNYCCLSNQYSSAAVCYNCSANCLTCSSSSNCSNCAISYSIMGGYCCLSNQYISGSTCLNCSSNCLTCSSSSNCSVCATSYLIMGGYCCLSNQYISGSSCLNCPGVCSVCTNFSYCTSCITNLVLMLNYCCQSNQYYSGTVCINCSSHCQTCLNSSNCTICATDYVLMLGFCCLSNQYYANNVCNDCPSTCLTCLSTEQCTQCISGYSLLEGQCLKICDAGGNVRRSIQSLVQGLSQASLNQFPGSRIIFSGISTLMLSWDHFFLYNFHNRNYSCYAKSIMEDSMSLFQQKGKLFFNQMLPNSTILGQSLDFYKNSTDSTFFSVRNIGYGFLANTVSVFVIQYPSILMVFIFLAIAFYFTRQSRLSTFVRPFSLIGILILMFVEGNVQQFVFFFMTESIRLQSQTIFIKLLHAASILVFSLFFVLFIGIYFIVCGYYLRVVGKYFCQGMKRQLNAIFFLTRRGIFGVCLGFAHSMLLSLPNIQLFALTAIQSLNVFIMFIFYFQFRTQQKIRISFDIILSLLRICFILSFYYYQNQFSLMVSLTDIHYYFIVSYNGVFILFLIAEIIGFIILTILKIVKMCKLRKTKSKVSNNYIWKMQRAKKKSKTHLQVMPHLINRKNQEQKKRNSPPHSKRDDGGVIFKPKMRKNPILDIRLKRY